MTLPRGARGASPAAPADGAGDATWPAAAVDFYIRHYVDSARLAYLVVLDKASAEDVAQDALLRVLDRWEAVRAPLPYLRRAVVTVAIDGARKDVRLDRSAGQVEVGRDDADVADRLALAEGLRRLTVRERAAVVLRYYEDAPYREIAAVLGCQPSSARALVSRGLTSLRAHVTTGER